MNDQSAFFSWPGIIAIGAIIAFFGAAIDFLLRKRHKEHILKKLRDFEDRIAAISIREWQFVIAQAFIDFWGWLSKLFEKLFAGIGSRLNREMQSSVLRKLILILLISWGLVILQQPSLLGISEHLMISLAVPIKVFLICVVLSAATVSPLWKTERFNRKKAGDTINWLIYKFHQFYFTSALFSTIAIAAGKCLIKRGQPESTNSFTFWFITTEHPVSLAEEAVSLVRGLILINLTFDLVTILASAWLLKWMLKKRKWIISVAVIDIAVCAALTIMLYATIRTIVFEHATFVYELRYTTNWLFDFTTFGITTMHPDAQLFPLLLTTFIPVVLYMSLFIILSLVISPLMRLTGYMSGLLGEKEKTPFLELSVVVSTLIVAIKALTEWPWFAARF